MSYLKNNCNTNVITRLSLVIVLDTLPLEDETSHKAPSYAASVKAVLERFGIPSYENLVCVTTDGAKVNFSVATLLQTDFQRFNGFIGQGYLPRFKANIRALENFFTDELFAYGKIIVEQLEIDLGFIKNNIDSCIKVLVEINEFIKKYSRDDIYLGEMFHDIKTLQKQITIDITPLANGESTDEFKYRFDELLEDEYVAASALLNPTKACRVLKRTAQNTVKFVVTHKPETLKNLQCIQNLTAKYAHLMPEVVPIIGTANSNSHVFTLTANVDIFADELKGIWKGFTKGTHRKNPTRESIDKIKTMKIDWEYVFSDVMEEDSDVELVE